MVHVAAVYLIYLSILTLLAVPLSGYLAQVMQGERTRLDRVLGPVERLLYRLSFVQEKREQTWAQYAISAVLFTGMGTALLYLILRLQGVLGWNPAGVDGLRPALAANTALSFTTTTTWQAYAGETTMSYVSQMVGLTAQNLIAGAVGLAVGFAFIRGLTRQEGETLGNFWVDLVRGLLWVLLPLAFVVALLLASQGVIATLGGAVTVTTLEGVERVIPRGPAAAMVAVNHLGTNGGGFFNANGAHPFENPTPLTNLVAKLAIALVPASLLLTFGRVARRPRMGWTLYGVLVVLLAVSVLVPAWYEGQGNPRVEALGTADLVNLEGKEMRLGVGDSALAIGVTAGGSTGALVNSNDSLIPVSAAVLFVNMAVGGVSFGGLGTGLYTIVIFAMIAAFIGGQMVGRSAQFLGKRLEQRVIVLSVIFLLIAPAVVLGLTALSAVLEDGTSRLAQAGPHGLTALLVTYATTFASNGQGFGSFGADTNFIHATTILAMLAGRFLPAITALAVAGTLVSQTRTAPHEGTLPSEGPLFGGFLFVLFIVLNMLTLLPALALGPLLEQVELT